MYKTYTKSRVSMLCLYASFLGGIDYKSIYSHISSDPFTGNFKGITLHSTSQES